MSVKSDVDSQQTLKISQQSVWSISRKMASNIMKNYLYDAKNSQFREKLVYHNNNKIIITTIVIHF